MERKIIEKCFGDCTTSCKALNVFICNGEPDKYCKCSFYKGKSQANEERIRYFKQEREFRNRKKNKGE